MIVLTNFLHSCEILVNCSLWNYGRSTKSSCKIHLSFNVVLIVKKMLVGDIKELLCRF